MACFLAVPPEGERESERVCVRVCAERVCQVKQTC